LREALRTYQDNAGVIEKLTFAADATEADLPDHFLKVVVAEDALGNYHEAIVDDEAISITTRTSSVAPYTVHYFVDLVSYDPDDLDEDDVDDLPSSIIGKTLEYLVALIDIPNTQRARRMSGVTGQQIEFPSDDVLLQRKEQIRLSMEDEEAIIPMVSVRV
jgi:hypothetical protein